MNRLRFLKNFNSCCFSNSSQMFCLLSVRSEKSIFLAKNVVKRKTTVLNLLRPSLKKMWGIDYFDEATFAQKNRKRCRALINLLRPLLHKKYRKRCRALIILMRPLVQQIVVSNLNIFELQQKYNWDLDC